MDIVDLSATVAMLLTISLATERLVSVVKTLSPTWFADEKKNEAKEVDLIADRWRRIRVQLVAFLCAWVTAAFLVKVTEGQSFNFIEAVFNGTVDLGTIEPPTWIVGLLASGGSAFWAQVVGYTSAVKDIAVTNCARTSLEFTATAEAMGRAPIDSGVVASAAERRTKRADAGRVLDQAIPALT
jgi:hypothetical protein